jgi:hypothetical protein
MVENGKLHHHRLAQLSQHCGSVFECAGTTSADMYINKLRLPERTVKATAYLNAKLDQETALRSPGTPSGLSMHTSRSA